MPCHHAGGPIDAGPGGGAESQREEHGKGALQRIGGEDGGGRARAHLVEGVDRPDVAAAHRPHVDAPCESPRYVGRWYRAHQVPAQDDGGDKKAVQI